MTDTDMALPLVLILLSHIVYLFTFLFGLCEKLKAYILKILDDICIVQLLTNFMNIHMLQMCIVFEYFIGTCKLSHVYCFPLVYVRWKS